MKFIRPFMPKVIDLNGNDDDVLHNIEYGLFGFRQGKRPNKNPKQRHLIE